MRRANASEQKEPDELSDLLKEGLNISYMHHVQKS